MIHSCSQKAYSFTGHRDHANPLLLPSRHHVDARNLDLDLQQWQPRARKDSPQLGSGSLVGARLFPRAPSARWVFSTPPHHPPAPVGASACPEES